MGDGKKVVEEWNRFIRALLSARSAWNRCRELMDSQPDLDDLPVPAIQRLSKMQPKTRFGVLMPRFVDYYRLVGGLEEMVIELPKEETKEKEEENDE